MSNFSFRATEENQIKTQDESFSTPIREGFQSPVVCSSVHVPESIDRELIRSVFLFGAEDSLRETSRRIPSFPSLSSTAKRAIHDRRRFLLRLKKNDPEKLQSLHQQYSIPSDIQRHLTLEFDKQLSSPIATRTTTMEYALKPFMKQYGKTLNLYFLLLLNLFLQKSFLSFLHTAAEPDIPEYSLNLGKGENNVNGIFAYTSPSFVWDEEQVEVLGLIKQVPDIADVRTGANAPNGIAMSLLPDGSGVLVEEPAVPTFMVENFDGLYDGFQNVDIEYAMHTTHAVCMTAIKQSPARMKKKYILKFPENLKCQTGYMNPSSGRLLRGNVKVSKSLIGSNKGQNVVSFTHVTIRFVAVIKNPERKLLRAEDASNDVEDVLAGMFASTSV